MCSWRYRWKNLHAAAPKLEAASLCPQRYLNNTPGPHAGAQRWHAASVTLLLWAWRWREGGLSPEGGGWGGDVFRAARLGSEGPASALRAVSCPRRSGPGPLHTSSWLDVALSPQGPGVSVVNVAVRPLFCQLEKKKKSNSQLLGCAFSFQSTWLNFHVCVCVCVCVYTMWASERGPGMKILLPLDLRKASLPVKKACSSSLLVQWLRLCLPNTGGLGLIPGQGTRPHKVKQINTYLFILFF